MVTGQVNGLMAHGTINANYSSTISKYGTIPSSGTIQHIGIVDLLMNMRYIGHR